jgi:hypothetical protein
MLGIITSSLNILIMAKTKISELPINKMRYGSQVSPLVIIVYKKNKKPITAAIVDVMRNILLVLFQTKR